MSKISDFGVAGELESYRTMDENRTFFFPRDVFRQPSNKFLNYDIEIFDTFDDCQHNFLKERERKKLAKRKKVARREKIKMDQTRAHAVGNRVCYCCGNKLDYYGNKRDFVNLENRIMSQETESRTEDQIAAANLSEKRRAWRISATTAAASEKDSLLSNSGDDRLSASFDSRQEQRQERESNRSPADVHCSENSNLLRVPSPARRSGFYSTTPSTDEGIGPDDHLPDENSAKASFDKSQVKEEKLEKSSDKQTNRHNTKEDKRLFHERSFSVESTPTRYSKPLYMVS